MAAIFIVLAATTGVVAEAEPHKAAAAAPLTVNYIVFIMMMENHSLGDITSSSAPYMYSLSQNYSLAANYHYVSGCCSLPNYFSYTAGNTLVSSDCQPTGCPQDVNNIVDILEDQGVSWHAYVEDYPSSCGSDCSPGNCYVGSDNSISGGDYYARHNPAVYFKDVTTDPTRCAKITRANSVLEGTSDISTDDLFLNSLGSTTTASSFTMVLPNGWDDMHDSSVSIGNQYLANLMPKILSSSIFQTQRAALFITFDDAASNTPLYAVWSGPAAKTMYSSSVLYNHYSFLKTLESNWGLSGLTSNDASAIAMNEFFYSGGSVGGSVVPLNKLDLLVPYIGFAMALSAVTAGAVLYVRHGKSKEAPANCVRPNRHWRNKESASPSIAINRLKPRKYNPVSHGVCAIYCGGQYMGEVPEIAREQFHS